MTLNLYLTYMLLYTEETQLLGAPPPPPTQKCGGAGAATAFIEVGRIDKKS
jgi:hypothetical protein